MCPRAADVAPPRGHAAEAAGCRRPGVRRGGPGCGIRRGDLRARRLHPRRVLLELRDARTSCSSSSPAGSPASGWTAVRERVAQLETRRRPRRCRRPTRSSIVQQVLDVSGDDRLAILLMSEIRIHALRDPQLGAAYLAQDDEMRASVAQIIDDIARGEVPARSACRRRGRAAHAHGVGERVGARRRWRASTTRRSAAARAKSSPGSRSWSSTSPAA